ncbi:uncharacterized protein LOC119611377 isoform X2 [Lucilia sericata]|uniref:uncharacterized protein LOC119611377 isoform X2 n=1 Tax=Lucilia sericata TaxID=13632 RepID=UPI0018A86512|nr:uncharacterized protein LOC119611377 isoform X2 [Lucilia sericata]
MDEVAVVTILISLIKKKKEKKNLKNKIVKKRSLWSREWLKKRNSGKDLSNMVLKELQLEDPPSFENFCRLPKHLFNKLLEIVGPTITKQDTILRQAIPASTRLLITLRYLSTGNTFTDMSYSFRVSVPAISIIIPETLKAIYYNLKDVYLKGCTTTEEWLDVATEFNNKWNFPMCLGAIDGFNSIILMAFVDADYKFIFVDVGSNGRANDASVFNQSEIGIAIRNEALNFPENQELPGSDVKVPFVFVADEAFRLSTRILKPYSQRNEHENKIFNYRLSRARRVSENCFGQLVNRFQILLKEITLDVEKAELITLTCCVLHNFLKIENHNDDSFQCTQRNATLTTIEHSPGHRSSNDASAVRDIFRTYFNNEGQVSWQAEAVTKFNF